MRDNERRARLAEWQANLDQKWRDIEAERNTVEAALRGDVTEEGMMVVARALQLVLLQIGHNRASRFLDNAEEGPPA